MERRAIAIQGTVQGVGFRPFVYGLASHLQLSGFVKNQAGRVQIEIEGESAPLDHFLSRLLTNAPPLANIETMSWQPIPPQGGIGFRIDPSDQGPPGSVVVAPDIATCADCLAELLNPRDRRFRYPFLNCTNCGPRLTIVTGAPYDRERTTMAAFPLCAACRAEYDDPSNRRFHAQPTACPVCGPHLQLLDAHGRPIEDKNPLAFFVAAIKKGQIGAIKGLGGYHLMCDAANQSAVTTLRRRKHREEKPFAVMVQNTAAAAELCVLSETERQILESHRSPIVLLQKRSDITLPEDIAPQNPRLGIMLPYTPLHHLLLRDMHGVPLVMTSGNRSDEPIAIDETDAIHRLSNIADLFLAHNRPINVRCDDSVTRIIGHHESPIRRSRGRAPEPISLPLPCAKPILAVGGQLKATFALANDRRAILSHHLGDLDHFAAYRAFERDITLYEKLFSLQPVCLAHDLHPDYASTHYAQRRAAAENIPCVPVQHHHAHMASCMAEHGLTEPVIGVTFDGAGFGPDGAIWGGEFLIGDYTSFERAAHLRYIPMPGADQAARDPWRMAAAHLADAQATCHAYERRLPPASLKAIRQMLDRQFNCPLTSSAGRLFDAVASLIGLRDTTTHEGQAAMQLECLAASISPDTTYPFTLPPSPTAIPIDTRLLILAITRDVNTGIAPPRIARRFHSTLVEIIRTVCLALRNTHNLNTITLSGGVFMNALLTTETIIRLEQEHFRVYSHRKVPPNDGGLSLGQLAVAIGQQRSR